MKQSASKNVKSRNYVSKSPVSLVALIVLTLTTNGVFSSAKTLVAQTTAQESQQTDVRELKLGQPSERELAGGEGHSYRVTLTVGQYLRVVVEQKGIDVVVRLFGPDSKQITEVDSPNGTQGPEPVSAIAEATGAYRLEVRSLEKKTAGRYEIKLEKLRESRATDRERIAVERVSAEAGQLHLRGTAESLRRAIELFKEAQPLWHALGDREQEADTLMSIGLIYIKVGELEKALEYHGQVLQISRSSGNQRQELVALHSIGAAYGRMGQWDKALEYSLQTLPLTRASGDRDGEGLALVNIGVNYLGLGRLQEALNYFNEALPLKRAVRDSRGEATTLANIASAYRLSGEYQRALDYYKQALSLRRELGERQRSATLLGSLGGIYTELNQPRESLEYYHEALPLMRSVGDRRGEASMLSGIGIAYSRLREWHRALDYYNQALALWQALGNQGGEAVELSLIGEVYSISGEPQKALKYLARALPSAKDPAVEAFTLVSMARAQHALGNLTEARSHIEAALKIIETTHAQFTHTELRTSFLASKQSRYAFYIDLLMQMHRKQPSTGHDATALQVSERARARSLLKILTEARADIRQGVGSGLLERERSSQQQLTAKSERLTRLLSSKHTEEEKKVATKEVEALLTNYQDVQAEIRAKSPHYAALTQPQPLSLKEIQQLLDAETMLLEYTLGEERSYLWAVTSTSIKSLELPKRSEIETVARKVYEALTARNKVIRFEKQKDKQARVAMADAEYFANARVLSQMILGPLGGHLGRKRMLIVSDGALQYVPFGALPLPGRNLDGQRSSYRPLISEHEIVSLPSASTLAVLRKEMVGRQRGAKTVAVLADPVFQDDDSRVKRDSAIAKSPANDLSKSAGTRDWEGPMERSARDTGGLEFRRLPYSRLEADAITAFLPSGASRKSLDFEASRATVTSADLSNYRIVHFATHGLLNSQHPELSGIVLSLVDQNGKPQDGFLRLHEIYNLKLGADLVVLSACRTALGQEIKGEGLVGLTRGFMYAGAPRVVASLWAVDDEMTAEWMKRFYRAMLIKHERPAAALRTAQLSLWKEKRLPPYFWAAFVLQGEWK